MGVAPQRELTEQELVSDAPQIRTVQSGPRRLIKSSPLLAAVVSAPWFATADLRVIVQPVEKPQGQVMVAIYDNEQGFGKARRAGISRTAEQGQMKFTFPHLPIGDYAVMVYHDLNGNGQPDTNSVGVPKGPWGGSMAQKPLYHAPTWSDTKFSLPADGCSVTVNLA